MSFMMRFPLLLLVLVPMVLALSGCGRPQMDMAQVTAAQPVGILPTQSDRSQGDYRIGTGDKLNITVFQVEDLSFEEMVVDSAGNVQLPLIGSVRSAGLTPAEMSSSIAERLSVRYLRNPQVTVTVVEAASQKITVDGAVTKPGVYVMRGSTSLLQAVAMAEGPSRVANLSMVAVFRTIDGQRSVGVFDLGAIRQGRAPDPEVLGDDIVVVDTSRLQATMRDVVGALPALSVFRPY
ncbi:MAG: polysaccharide export protein [Alphaproteobacteria bacterium]|nr:MAG: polysaccharide export protein [Alphaproteobacteria bacterium]